MMKCKYPHSQGALVFGCGQCLPCRINRRRIWTHRLMLESMMHEGSCFVTLTYDDAHIPSDGSLSPRLMQLWIKKLRRYFSDRKVRYYLVGEYGEGGYSRVVNPHYHMALFGVAQHEFPYQFWFLNKKGQEIYKSDELWSDEKGPKGSVEVRELCQDTCQYICGYIMKKLTNVKDPKVADQLAGLHPEFCRMSRRPGIGVSAMDVVAGSFMSTPQGCDEGEDVPKSLRHGGKLWPIGRFLTKKLRIKTFRDDKEMSTKIWNDRRPELMREFVEMLEKGKYISFAEKSAAESKAVVSKYNAYKKRRVL